MEAATMFWPAEEPETGVVISGEKHSIRVGTGDYHKLLMCMVVRMDDATFECMKLAVIQHEGKNKGKKKRG